MMVQWGILPKAGFLRSVIVMVAWDEMISRCLPWVPGWGSVNLSLKPHHRHSATLYEKGEVGLWKPWSDLGPYSLVDISIIYIVVIRSHSSKSEREVCLGITLPQFSCAGLLWNISETINYNLFVSSERSVKHFFWHLIFWFKPKLVFLSRDLSSKVPKKYIYTKKIRLWDNSVAEKY